jgi:hypothetical protein
MKRPSLPPATIVDGRSLYTSGDMRAYYDLALSTAHDEFTKPDDTITKPASSASIDDISIDDLMNIFGMKK